MARRPPQPPNPFAIARPHPDPYSYPFMSEERPFAAPGPAAERLRTVRERIAAAARRVGRDPSGVGLVAVSKTFGADRAIELARLGQLVFGENRVQEARDKIPEVRAALVATPPTFRLIGHLQRNKVRQALALFDTVDGADSVRLLDELEKESERAGRRTPTLLEFNCSGEASKSGFDPGQAAAVAERVASLQAVEVRGLMTIGPLAPDPEAARPAFRRLREVRDALQDRLGRPLPELSMGMSGDLEIGIEEGATLVRVGTALFGERT